MACGMRGQLACASTCCPAQHLCELADKPCSCACSQCAALQNGPGISRLARHVGKPYKLKRSDISRLGPHLQQEWDQAANAHLGSIVVSPQSGRKVEQRQVQDRPAAQVAGKHFNRTKGTGCPYETGSTVCPCNSLAHNHPEVARERDTDEPRDDDPVDMLGAAGAAPVKSEQGACGDIQKAAAHALARHQGAVAAGLAATSKEMPRGACPQDGVASVETTSMHHCCCSVPWNARHLYSTLSIHSRHVPSSDVVDNCINPLMPLLAIWTHPGHDFV